MNFVQIAKDAKAAAANCISEDRLAANRAGAKAYYVHREIEVIALDANGDRCGLGEPFYLAVKDCSGKNMRKAIESVLRDEKDAVQIGVCGGTDEYDSMDDMMKGYDYTPYSGSWDLEDIPVEDQAMIDAGNAQAWECMLDEAHMINDGVDQFAVLSGAKK